MTINSMNMADLITLQQIANTLNFETPLVKGWERIIVTNIGENDEYTLAMDVPPDSSYKYIYRLENEFRLFDDVPQSTQIYYYSPFASNDGSHVLMVEDGFCEIRIGANDGPLSIADGGSNQMLPGMVAGIEVMWQRRCGISDSSLRGCACVQETLVKGLMDGLPVKNPIKSKAIYVSISAPDYNGLALMQHIVETLRIEKRQTQVGIVNVSIL